MQTGSALVRKTDGAVIKRLPSADDPLKHVIEISPGEWQGVDPELYEVVPFIVNDPPQGGYTFSSETEPIFDGTNVNVTRTYVPVETPRRKISKSVVQDRLQAAGKLDAAFSLLQQKPYSFARWFAPDQPAVFCDDPDTVDFVQALGLDPSIVLSPE